MIIPTLQTKRHMKFTRLIRDKGTTFAGVIPSGVLITGNLAIAEVQEALRIEGSIKGNIVASTTDTASIYLASTGSVTGDITCKSVVVDGGFVVGNISAQQVVLKGNAVVKGDITYMELSVEAGSRINGQLALINPTEPA